MGYQLGTDVIKCGDCDRSVQARFVRQLESLTKIGTKGRRTKCKLEMGHCKTRVWGMALNLISVFSGHFARRDPRPRLIGVSPLGKFGSMAAMHDDGGMNAEMRISIVIPITAK